MKEFYSSPKACCLETCFALIETFFYQYKKTSLLQKITKKVVATVGYTIYY